jgi:diacylglycerol O-acyltransferase
VAQLNTTRDSAFLNPDTDRQANLAIGAVAIVDGTVPDFGRLKRFLAERVRLIPRCTQVLRTSGFNGAQQWIEDPEIDLDHHVRRVTIHGTGDDPELSRVIAHALERPLEMDRPLWECWIVEGLQGNQWAILMKVHHYLAEGASAAHLLTRLCDDADGEMFANPVGNEPISSQPAQKRSWVDTLWRASAIAGNLTNTLTAAIWPVLQPSTKAAATMRRYQTVRVPLAAVEDVCAKFSVTTNDVALTAIAEGFRHVLLHRGEQPHAGSLRILQKTDDRALLPYLPVEHDDPVQRLRTVHSKLNGPRQHDQRAAAAIVDLATNLPPVMLCAKAVQLVMSMLPQPGIVTLATNGSGPRSRLGLMGKTVQRLLPIPPPAAQLSSGVAVLSYGDELVFGITADYEAAMELALLAAGIEHEMARLMALSHDKVLLFSKERRKRPSRAVPVRGWGGAHVPGAPHRPASP